MAVGTCRRADAGEKRYAAERRTTEVLLLHSNASAALLVLSSVKFVDQMHSLGERLSVVEAVRYALETVAELTALGAA